MLKVVAGNLSRCMALIMTGHSKKVYRNYRKVSSLLNLGFL